MWERNWNGGRIESPDFRIDPTIRHTFWSLFIGGSCYWVIDNTRQFVIQRYLSLRSVKHARRAAKYYVFGLTLFLCICMYNGLVLYARYHDCDPLTSQKVKIKDQMMAFFVMEILRDMLGLRGVFIAGIFSGVCKLYRQVISSKEFHYHTFFYIFYSCFEHSFVQSQLHVSDNSRRFCQVIFQIPTIHESFQLNHENDCRKFWSHLCLDGEYRRTARFGVRVNYVGPINFNWMLVRYLHHWIIHPMDRSKGDVIWRFDCIGVDDKFNWKSSDSYRKRYHST